MKYSSSHDWIVLQGEVATLGISAYACRELGEIVHVELPRTGALLPLGAEVAVLESTKAAVDLYTPVAGTIVAINEELLTHPRLLNLDPEGRGWLFKVRIDALPEGLMDPEAYQQFIRGVLTNQ